MGLFFYTPQVFSHHTVVGQMVLSVPNSVALEITSSDTNVDNSHTNINVVGEVRSWGIHVRNFINDTVVPYTTPWWLKCYMGYTGLFWGLVALLWHFNNSHGNMDTEITVPGEWYISNAFNTWTSIAYMIAVPYTHITMKLSLISLAVSSFCLWSDSGDICRFIDVTSIHWVIVSVMLQKTTSSRRYATNHIVNVVAVIFMIYYISSDTYHGILAFYGDHITFTVGAVTAYNILITFNSHGARPTLMTGCVVCLLGFWCKFRDILYGDAWGTGVFHLMTAIGLSVVLLPTKPLKLTE